jgi:predicted GNAT family acetyltransferase
MDGKIPSYRRHRQESYDCQMSGVNRNASAHRFEIADEPSAFLFYAESKDRIRLIHTEVASKFRGRGYASDLARAALEYARDAHLRVEPVCPFVRSYLERHPEYASLVDSTSRG